MSINCQPNGCLADTHPDDKQLNPYSWTLLIVVAILSTLLTAIAFLCLTLFCRPRCAGDSSLWQRGRPRGWLKRMPGLSFPPSPRAEVELNEIARVRRSLVEYPRGTPERKQNRSGTSTQLTFEGNPKKLAIPALRPPPSWPPSPPFPPRGGLPKKPRSRPPAHPPNTQSPYCREWQQGGKHPGAPHSPYHCETCLLKRSAQAFLRKEAARIVRSTFVRMNFHPTAARGGFRAPRRRVCEARYGKGDAGVESRYKGSRSPASPNHGSPSGNGDYGFRRNLMVHRGPGGSELGGDKSFSPECPECNIYESRKTSESRGRSQGQNDRLDSLEDARSSEEPKTTTDEPGKLANVIKDMPQPETSTYLSESGHILTDSMKKSRSIHEKEHRQYDKSKAKKKRRTRPIPSFAETPASTSNSLPFPSTFNKVVQAYWNLSPKHPLGNEDTSEDALDTVEAAASLSWDHLTPDPSPAQEIGPRMYSYPTENVLTSNRRASEYPFMDNNLRVDVPTTHPLQ